MTGRRLLLYYNTIKTASREGTTGIVLLLVFRKIAASKSHTIVNTRYRAYGYISTTRARDGFAACCIPHSTRKAAPHDEFRLVDEKTRRNRPRILFNDGVKNFESVKCRKRMFESSSSVCLSASPDVMDTLHWPA
jgi:hypothetical protein